MASGYGDKKEMFEGDVSVGTLDVLFTPCGGGSGREAGEARRLDFSGFQGEGQSQGEKMIRRRMYESEREKPASGENVLHRKICDLEWNLKRVLERLSFVERTQEVIKAENVLLKKRM